MSKFSVVEQGYDIEEVNDFLKVITDEFEKLIIKNKELEDNNEQLLVKNEEFNSKELSLETYLSQLETFVSDKVAEKARYEEELIALEKKIEDYKEALRLIFYNHIELMEKLK